MPKAKILILDNHMMIREMWVGLLGKRPECRVVGASGKWREGLRIIRENRPDIVLLDIQLFDAEGHKSIPKILKMSPSMAIIATSYYAEPVMAKRMLGLGAMGYVTKNSPISEFLTAIRQVMDGNIYVCKEITQLESRKAVRPKSKGPDLHLLTKREQQVVNLVAKGFSSKQISANLGMSIKTTEVHRHNILRKLHLKNSLHLVSLLNTVDLLKKI